MIFDDFRWFSMEFLWFFYVFLCFSMILDDFLVSMVLFSDDLNTWSSCRDSTTRPQGRASSAATPAGPRTSWALGAGPMWNWAMAEIGIPKAKYLLFSWNFWNLEFIWIHTRIHNYSFHWDIPKSSNWGIFGIRKSFAFLISIHFGGWFPDFNTLEVVDCASIRQCWLESGFRTAHHVENRSGNHIMHLVCLLKICYITLIYCYCRCLYTSLEWCVIYSVQCIYNRM